jgi:hypothetical protein
VLIEITIKRFALLLYSICFILFRKRIIIDTLNSSFFSVKKQNET